MFDRSVDLPEIQSGAIRKIAELFLIVALERGHRFVNGGQHGAERITFI